RDAAREKARQGRGLQRPCGGRFGDGGHGIERRLGHRQGPQGSRGALFPMSGERDNTAQREDARALSSVILSHAGGLHARPAIKVTQLAKRFTAQVWIGLSETGPW